MPMVKALVDSNVIIAAVAEAHEHHAPSLALVQASTGDLAVAAHSYAEAFTTLTRRGEHAPFRWPADEAWAALESIAAITRLIGLTPAQTFDAVRSFAAGGGIGARIYDHLIGQAASMAGVASVITWNTGHLRSLFPDLTVETPSVYLSRMPLN